MKRKIAFLLLLLIVFSVFNVVSCNVVQRKYVSESYRMSGDALEAARVSMRTLCDNGVFTPAKCEELKLSYELAVISFIMAGDALVQANLANRIVDDILTGIKNDIREIENGTY